MAYGPRHTPTHCIPNNPPNKYKHKTKTPQDLSGLKDILYGNLQRDRGLRAILEAVLGTALLLKLQPRLGALFSLVIPSVATVTVRACVGAWVLIQSKQV